jgi:hypothetical protein
LIAMEFLEGVTLRHRIPGKPLDIDTVMLVGVEVADALDAAPVGCDQRGALVQRRP